MARSAATVALALGVLALGATTLQRGLGAGVWWSLTRTEGDYRHLRMSRGFYGLQIDTLAAALDAQLPADTPIALSKEVSEDSAAAQRLAEGLYPRRVVPTARHVLSTRDNPGGALAAYRAHGYLHLTDTGGENAGVGATPSDTDAAMHANLPWPPVAWFRFFLLVVSLAGWGGLAVAWPGRWAGAWMGPDESAGQPALLLLAGGCTLAVLTSVTTWAQIPVTNHVWAGVGLAAAAWQLGTYVRKRRATPARNTLATILARWRAWAPEALFFVIVFACLVHMLKVTPVLGWDGRSIWFFRAHQLAHRGMFALDDAANLAYLASHPSYPLFFPAWLSHFTALGGHDERQAALGIAPLLTTLGVLVWALMRPLGGRLVAMLFAATLLFTGLLRLREGYPDPLVTLTLVIASLAFVRRETVGWGLLAALVAALTKREGLVLATMLLGLQAIVSPHFATLKPTRRWLVALCPLLPALGHALWYSLQGLPEIYSGAGLRSLSSMGMRLPVILQRFWGLTGPSPIIFVALAAPLALLRRSTHRHGYLIAVAALGAFVFCVVALVMTPLPFVWHVALSLPRIVMHAVWLMITAALVHTARPDPQAAPSGVGEG